MTLTYVVLWAIFGPAILAAFWVALEPNMERWSDTAKKAIDAVVFVAAGPAVWCLYAVLRAHEAFDEPEQKL